MKHHILVTLFLLFATGWPQETQDENDTIDPKSLNKAFIHAVNYMRAGQQDNGNWITWETLVPFFQDAKQQFDVWNAAVMIDILEPVKTKTGIEELLQRTRAYLHNQIESTGIVRWLGAESNFWPDWDDTALAWRLAPLEDEKLLQSVMAMLEQHRLEEGLYLTWYNTKPPSKLPTPPTAVLNVDIGVQMHVYLFLAIYAPEKASALCTKMQQFVSDERFWTYGEFAPAVYPWRVIDLSLQGCDLRMPDTFYASHSKGQHTYLVLSQLLRDLVLGSNPPVLREDVLSSLGHVMHNDFALIEEIPLLMFHTEFHQLPVPAKYFWSRNIAYALWLRLYVESSRRFENWPLPKLPFRSETLEAGIKPPKSSLGIQ